MSKKKEVIDMNYPRTIAMKVELTFGSDFQEERMGDAFFVLMRTMKESFEKRHKKNFLSFEMIEENAG